MCASTFRTCLQTDYDTLGRGALFIKAWADPKAGKVFCLSEGPSREAVQRVHERAGHRAQEIYEVSIEQD